MVQATGRPCMLCPHPSPATTRMPATPSAMDRSRVLDQSPASCDRHSLHAHGLPVAGDFYWQRIVTLTYSSFANAPSASSSSRAPAHTTHATFSLPTNIPHIVPCVPETPILSARDFCERDDLPAKNQLPRPRLLRPHRRQTPSS
ncbi:hypothetical protein C8J57DRAFT_1233697 [Mycena rebaudengoi]|nr:hypothetical protein C8J57DRAFT_1233697 [Mycena rebaudengoi]